MRRLLATLLALLLLSACGDGSPTVTQEGSPTPTPSPTETPTPEPTPADTASPEATPTPTPGPEDDEDANGTATTTTTAFFVRSDDSGLWVEPATRGTQSSVAVARTAMEFLVAGDPEDPNLETLAGPSVEVLGTNIDGDVLIVDLSGEIRNNRTGSGGEEAFAQQLAHTAAQFDGVERVQLRVDGNEISDLWGHIDWSEPIEPDPFALSPITFDTHTWREEVPVGDVTVGGEANTFEATVELRLVGPNGDVVEETFTTATSGSGERGRWEHTFYLETAVTWTIEAIEPDPSDGEGRPPFTTTLELRGS
jgi:hypothetical protein